MSHKPSTAGICLKASVAGGGPQPVKVGELIDRRSAQRLEKRRCGLTSPERFAVRNLGQPLPDH